MNGKDLMESMSYVDEKYIDEAQTVPGRRIPWQPLTAAAACLVLALGAFWRLLPTQSGQMDEAASMEMAVGTARSMEQEEAELGVGSVLMAAPVPVQMTVRVVEQGEEGLVCQIMDPGTSGYQPDDQVTIVLPESLLQAAAQTTESAEEAPVYQVTFFRNQEGSTITADTWTPAEGN